MKAFLTRFLLWCGIVKHPAQKERDALVAWYNGPFRTHAREHPDAVAASSPTCVWCGRDDAENHSCYTTTCKWCELYSKYTCSIHGCDMPGIGWYCLLEPDHNGPCRVMRESEPTPRWPPVPPDAKDRLE